VYAKLGQLEILSSYITEVSVGDMLTMQALVTNPLDWQHFYEKISTIKKGDKTDFTVVTTEGDRVVGFGNIVELEKWTNHGQYGFKIKVNIKRQKSLTDRRIRGPGKIQKTESQKEKQPVDNISRPYDQILKPIVGKSLSTIPATSNSSITGQDMAEFTRLLKESVTLDMAE